MTKTKLQMNDKCKNSNSKKMFEIFNVRNWSLVEVWNLDFGVSRVKASIQGARPAPFFGLRKQNGAGYTLIEVLIVIVIMASLIVLTLTALPDLAVRRSLNNATQSSISLLEEARSRTLSSREISSAPGAGSTYGVYFNSAGSDKKLILFSGTRYTGFNAVKTVKLGGTISVTAPDFTAGTWIPNSFNVSFRRLTGEAQQSGDIVITETRSNEQQTISVLSSGLVQ